MAPDPNQSDDPRDVAALAAHADALVEAVSAELSGWVEGSVRSRYEAWAGHPLPEPLVSQARVAGERTTRELLPRLRALLDADVDQQRTNPLALLRGAGGAATSILAAAGVPPVARDREAQRLFPDDPYDLTVAAFADIGPRVHETGLVWGAAKAHVVLARRRREGR